MEKNNYTREINNLLVEKIINEALIEDLGNGDITTANILPTESNYKVKGEIMAKEEGIMAGGFIVGKIYEILAGNKNSKIDIKLAREREKVSPQKRVISIEGSPEIILQGERVSLNFLQRLSGIATQTNKIVKLAAPYGVKILDTRKTTPGLRQLEKYAVRVGGGYNHRMGLYDGVMIKDNHKKTAGSIKNALTNIINKIGPMVKICVEATSGEEAFEAFEHGAHHILLDNMDKEEIAIIVNNFKDKPVTLEVSGNIQEGNIEELAKTGVDYISCGKLTHSFNSLDFSMNF